MPKRKNPNRYQGGTVIVNRKDYSIRDPISPGKLVAWAEWIPATKTQSKEVKDERLQGVQTRYDLPRISV